MRSLAPLSLSCLAKMIEHGEGGRGVEEAVGPAGPTVGAPIRGGRGGGFSVWFEAGAAPVGPETASE